MSESRTSVMRKKPPPLIRAHTVQGFVSTPEKPPSSTNRFRPLSQSVRSRPRSQSARSLLRTVSVNSLIQSTADQPPPPGRLNAWVHPKPTAFRRHSSQDRLVLNTSGIAGAISENEAKMREFEKRRLSNRPASAGQTGREACIHGPNCVARVCIWSKSAPRRSLSSANRKQTLSMDGINKIASNSEADGKENIESSNSLRAKSANVTKYIHNEERLENRKSSKLWNVAQATELVDNREDNESAEIGSNQTNQSVLESVNETNHQNEVENNSGTDFPAFKKRTINGNKISTKYLLMNVAKYMLDNGSAILERRQKARERFRWAYRMVSSLVTFQAGLLCASKEQTTCSAKEMQWQTLYLSTEARKLAFNRNHFVQNKSSTKLPRWARTILQKESSERSEDECKKIHALLRGLHNFDKFTQKIQLAMCRAFMYYRIEPLRVILRKGHIGQNFYFVYSGSVFVNVPDVNAFGDKFSKTEAILSRGDSFGEVALLKEVPRSATVTGREECELLVVDKDIFSKACPRIFDIELEERSIFVRKNPLFHEKYWSEENIQDICFDAQIQEYKTGKVISSNSALDEWMYICMEGSCRIIKCLSLDERTGESKHQQLQQREGEEMSVEYIEKHRQLQQQQSQEEDYNYKSKDLNQQEQDRDTFNSKTQVTDQKGPVSGNLQYKRDQMLTSLGLNYPNTALMEEADDQGMELAVQKMHVDNINPKVELLGSMTLTSLISRKVALYGGTCEFIYLDIGSLVPNNVFDLAEFLVPTVEETKSCLILVSSGCRVFRVKKNVVSKSINEEATEHAKYIARNNMYPSNEVLIKSLLEKEQWDEYKASVLQRAVTPYRNLKRHRHAFLAAQMGTSEGKSRSSSPQGPRRATRSARMIQVLKKDEHTDKEQGLEEYINENALGERDDLECEFESRMLQDAGAIDSQLQMRPLLPGSGRRSANYKSLIITPSPDKYQ